MSLRPATPYPEKLKYKATYYKFSYCLSYLDIVEILEMEGYKIAHNTISRWVLGSAEKLENKFLKRKKKVGLFWRMQVVFVRVRSKWCYLYRAIDENSKTVDYLLTRQRSFLQAYRFIKKAIENNGAPLLISICYKTETSNTREAVKYYNQLHSTNIYVAISSFLRYRMFRDNQLLRYRVRNYAPFRSFEAARRTITGIEVVRMIEKEQIKKPSKTHYKTIVSLLSNKDGK